MELYQIVIDISQTIIAVLGFWLLFDRTTRYARAQEKQNDVHEKQLAAHHKQLAIQEREESMLKAQQVERILNVYSKKFDEENAENDRLHSTELRETMTAREILEALVRSEKRLLGTCNVMREVYGLAEREKEALEEKQVQAGAPEYLYWGWISIESEAYENPRTLCEDRLENYQRLLDQP